MLHKETPLQRNTFILYNASLSIIFLSYLFLFFFQFCHSKFLILSNIDCKWLGYVRVCPKFFSEINMCNLHNNLLHSFWYCQYTGNWIREEMTYLYLYNYQKKWVTFKSQWGELISKRPDSQPLLKRVHDCFHVFPLL